MTLQVLHADDALVALDKPAGLLSVPGRGEHKQDCASARVLAIYPDALIVHRLDMATSGILVFGRGAAAQRALSIAFAGRAVRKRYEAIVRGLVAHDDGEINLPLITDWPNRPRQMVDHASGKPSLTCYRVLRRDAASNTTRLSLEPVTGRSHQVRVHLLAIGHPIVGDDLYGPDGAQRLLLHACELDVPHPVDGRTVQLRSEPPF